MHSASSLLLLGAVFVVLIFAQTQAPLVNVYGTHFQMPLLGFRWKIFEIPVTIDPNARDDSREAFREGMNRWYVSQIWFIQTYGNNTGTAYRFGEVASGGLVTVKFKVQDQKIAGSAQTSTNNDGIAISSVVTIDPFILGTTRLTAIMHELGHVLGLGHVPELVGDLMHTDAKSIRAPSTLDLYAVWLLSLGQKPDIAELPDSVPYMMPPQEVTNSTTVVMVSNTVSAMSTEGGIATAVSTAEHPTITTQTSLLVPYAWLGLLVGLSILSVVAVIGVLEYRRRSHKPPSMGESQT